MPLWAQVLDDLRRRLASGELSGRFPTDRELVDTYGVSRQTVRDAVRRLHDEGIVTRERGRGSFVRPPAIEQPLGNLYSLFRSIEAQGYEQRSIVRCLDERTDPTAAGHLEVAHDEPLVHVERVRLADDEPVAVDRAWLPSAVARPLLDADLTHTALHTELVQRCGVRPSGGWERIRPALPSPEHRRLLGVPARSPVFDLERLTRSGTVAVEWRRATIRGDRYAFTATWGDEPRDPAAVDPSP